MAEKSPATELQDDEAKRLAHLRQNVEGMSAQQAHARCPYLAKLALDQVEVLLEMQSFASVHMEIQQAGYASEIRVEDDASPSSLGMVSRDTDIAIDYIQLPKLNSQNRALRQHTQAIQLQAENLVFYQTVPSETMRHIKPQADEIVSGVTVKTQKKPVSAPVPYFNVTDSVTNVHPDISTKESAKNVAGPQPQNMEIITDQAANVQVILPAKGNSINDDPIDNQKNESQTQQEVIVSQSEDQSSNSIPKEVAPGAVMVKKPDTVPVKEKPYQNVQPIRQVTFAAKTVRKNNPRRNTDETASRENLLSKRDSNDLSQQVPGFAETQMPKFETEKSIDMPKDDTAEVFIPIETVTTSIENFQITKMVSHENTDSTGKDAPLTDMVNVISESVSELNPEVKEISRNDIEAAIIEVILEHYDIQGPQSVTECIAKINNDPELINEIIEVMLDKALLKSEKGTREILSQVFGITNDVKFINRIIQELIGRIAVKTAA